jgi:hypothetical protein
MRHPPLTLRTFLWPVLACVLLLLVQLDRREAAGPHVRLSASNTAPAICSGVPLLQVAAADLDDDHGPVLIACDGDAHHTPRREASTARAPHTARAPRSSTAQDPFVPRPPPARASL